MPTLADIFMGAIARPDSPALYNPGGRIEARRRGLRLPQTVPVPQPRPLDPLMTYEDLLALSKPDGKV